MSTISRPRDRNLTGFPESGLEHQLITEYLLSKGYQKADLRSLPEKQQKALMKEACIFAAVCLANIEAKSKFSQKIRFP